MVFKKILVPIDGSEQSTHAARIAVDIASKYESRVTLFHVAQIAADFSGMGNWPEISSEVVKKIENEWNRIGQEILEKVSQEIKSSGIDVSIELGRGNAAVEICNKAEKDEYDLIVIGSRGLGGVRATLLGSVSNRVSQMAGCPVLIIH